MKIGNVTDVHAAQFPLLCPLINYLQPRKNDADRKNEDFDCRSEFFKKKQLSIRR